MKILKGILSESKDYYIETKRKLEDRIAQLPIGSVKERQISGKKYYYLQERIGNRVTHKYLGKAKPEDLLSKLAKRKILKDELKKAREALKILKRAEGRKHG
jgi:hypothetical protein